MQAKMEITVDELNDIVNLLNAKRREIGIGASTPYDQEPYKVLTSNGELVLNEEFIKSYKSGKLTDDQKNNVIKTFKGIGYAYENI
jgi:hypothetical protein